MTFSFTWATNANYSAGPDVGTPTKVNPASTANGFVAGTIAAPQHINFLFDAVSDALVAAVDGVGGGMYTLTDPLVFTGDGVFIGAAGSLTIEGDFGIASGGAAAVGSGGSFQCQSGSDFIVASGTDVDWAADVDVQAGSVWTFASTAEQVFAGGSVITHESISGERYESGAICLLEDIDGLRVDTDGFTWVSTMTPQLITSAAGVPDWAANAAGVYIQTAVDGSDIIGFALPMLPGDTITTVTVRVTGQVSGGAGHAATPANPPVVQLITVSDAGAVVVVATATDAVTFPTYDSPHNIVLSGAGFPFTIPANLRVLVRVTGENGANSVAGTTAVLWVDGTGQANHIRNTTEHY
jgi:hypothetical protein